MPRANAPPLPPCLPRARAAGRHAPRRATIGAGWNARRLAIFRGEQDERKTGLTAPNVPINC